MQTAVYNALTRQFVFAESRIDTLLQLGINPSEWPDCEAKQIATSYLDLREKQGAPKARLQIAAKLSAIQSFSTLPSDDETLKAYYQRVLKFDKAVQLAESILKDPEKIDSHLDAYQNSKSPEHIRCDVIHDGEYWQNAFQQYFDETYSGKALVEIQNFPKLSKMIGGFNPGRVSMLAGQTGFGKTTVSLSLATAAAKNTSTLYVNMEMSLRDMWAKYVRMASGISFDKWVKGDICFEQVSDALDTENKSKPLFVTDGTQLTFTELESLIRYHKKKHDLGFVVIDYDQKIVTGQFKDEWRELQDVVTKLESAAKSLDLHIMVLAQADDNGLPKASKRSVQPVSTLLSLQKNESRYSLKAQKNRFGKHGAEIGLNIDFSTGKVTEGEHAKKSQNSVFGLRNFAASENGY